jgi:hypothetical protein
MVRTSSTSRSFTLEQAQQALPLVRLIVGDIVELQHSLEGQQGRIESLLARRKKLGRDVYDDELQEMRSSLDEDRRQLDRYSTELDDLGIQLLEASKGRVGFPTRVGGREIRYVWQLTERDIGNWQELGDQPEVSRPLEQLENEFRRLPAE